MCVRVCTCACVCGRLRNTDCSRVCCVLWVYVCSQLFAQLAAAEAKKGPGERIFGSQNGAKFPVTEEEWKELDSYHPVVRTVSNACTCMTDADLHTDEELDSHAHCNDPQCM